MLNHHCALAVEGHIFCAKLTIRVTQLFHSYLNSGDSLQGCNSEGGAVSTNAYESYWYAD